MRISDWSSDVCSSDLAISLCCDGGAFHVYADRARLAEAKRGFRMAQFPVAIVGGHDGASAQPPLELLLRTAENIMRGLGHGKLHFRSEEHTSELQSLMRNSYAVFCLKQNTSKTT